MNVIALSAAEVPDTITIWMAGDSTMANKAIDDDKQERGWGQMFPMMLQGAVKVENHATNGRSSKSFIDEGRWDKIMAGIKPGDYVIIEFGHNDEKANDPKRYTVPGKTFDANLTRMVKDVKKKGATPILMNSIVRRNFPAGKTDLEQIRTDKAATSRAQEGETLMDTHGEYLLSPRNVAEKQNITFIDLNKATHEFVQTLGPVESRNYYMNIPEGKYHFCPKGKIDNTHLNINGALSVARIAADSIAAHVPELAKLVKPHSEMGNTRYVMTRLGVQANTGTDMTAAIQEIIDIAAAHEGGIIVIPEGTFLCSTLRLHPSTTLLLEPGAILTAPASESDLNILRRP